MTCQPITHSADRFSFNLEVCEIISKHHRQRLSLRLLRSVIYLFLNSCYSIVAFGSVSSILLGVLRLLTCKWDSDLFQSDGITPTMINNSPPTIIASNRTENFSRLSPASHSSGMFSCCICLSFAVERQKLLLLAEHFVRTENLNFLKHHMDIIYLRCCLTVEGPAISRLYLLLVIEFM